MSSETAKRLIETIDELLAEAPRPVFGYRTEEDYTHLVELHGTIKGLASGLRLDAPPLEDAALIVHERHRLGPYVPVRGSNYSPPAAWERQLLSIRAAALALVEEPKPPATDINQETLALACLARIGANVAEIARQVGVPRATLYGWPKFKEALGRFRDQEAQARQGRRRGRRAGNRDFASEE